MHGSGLELALVFLLAAVIAVPVFKRFGLGAVLAYLVAGVVLGPDGLALVRDADRILNAAEIGVVMMLFVIGLELSPSRLRVMRKPVFGAGGLQVLLSALVLGGIALLFEHHWKTALVVGLGLALSSTAVSLQLLSERKELTSEHGRLGFAILLFQDLVAIPLLAAIPLLGGAKNETLTWTMVFHAIGAIAIVIFGGRLVLRHLFRIVARTRMPEVFTATALLVVLGIAWFMQLAGLSAGLGAFLAGVLLSDSEFRHELESQIDPFKGLLLGLFFIAVGMDIDLECGNVADIRAMRPGRGVGPRPGPTRTCWRHGRRRGWRPWPGSSTSSPAGCGRTGSRSTSSRRWGRWPTAHPSLRSGARSATCEVSGPARRRTPGSRRGRPSSSTTSGTFSCGCRPGWPRMRPSTRASV